MEICNKTKRPLKIRLPLGKLLRLAPGKVGQITPKAADFPPIKKMIEDGQLSIVSKGKTKSASAKHPSTGLDENVGLRDNNGQGRTNEKLAP